MAAQQPSRRPTLAAVLCSLAAALLAVAEAKVHHHTWDIAYHRKSLDCFEKLAVTINGEAPGPTIRAAQGDTVVVTVRNHLETENTGIHWHGIRQHGSPWADGTVGVTQCPILPGETFTYRFVVDRVSDRSHTRRLYTYDRPGSY
jgi:FtsP/CotA-like multicopper oxidase with cupredoxin domain